jgi:dUTP pyrophosphatase
MNDRAASTIPAGSFHEYQPRIPVQMKLLHPEAVVPEYGSAGAAGMDLRALLDAPYIILPAGEQKMVRTGIALQFNLPGYASLILPRSSTGGKLGVVLGNLVPLIDEDYTGEIRLILWNRTNRPRCIRHKERVAQLAIVPVERAEIRVVKEFDRDTARGAGGFGSTGAA